MNIVGLGSAGCGIADRFGEHEQYKTYKIDSDIYKEQLNYFQLKKQDSFQEYEERTYDLKDYFRNNSRSTPQASCTCAQISTFSMSRGNLRSVS